jgi:thiol-disulfide isomerase/thioredoxin
MKNFILFYAFIAILGVFSASAQGKAERKLPQFAFEDLQGKAFGQANIQKNIPTVVVFFDPYCDHCAKEAGWIRQMENSFKNINLVWVSTEEVAAIAKFKETHFKGTILTKLYFLRDAKYRFDGFFGYSVAPTVHVFNKDGKFIQSFDKETLPADILKASQVK